MLNKVGINKYSSLSTFGDFSLFRPMYKLIIYFNYYAIGMDKIV